MMTGASRQSLAIVRERLNALSEPSGILARLRARTGAASGRAQLADELYSVAALLASQPQLRRAAADPAASPQARAQLLERIVGDKVSESTLDLVTTAARLRWSSPWDLGDALEQVADDALLTAADADGSLGEVEDELFRLERTLSAESELTTLLDQADVRAERRIQLVRSVLRDKASPVTRALVEHAVASRRKISIEHAIAALLDRAAARQSRSVARVISAVALSDVQEEHIAAALSTMYGRPMAVRTSVEPAVEGGLVIGVGDEVIDGSVASRIAAARKAVAG
jgi:F-type H+-transporting ATPase subunit delta